MIARFLAVVNCLYGGRGNFERRFTLFAIVSGLTTLPSCLRQATVSRGRDRARSGNGTLHVPFPSSQVAKSPPGSLQESTCSPLTQGRLILQGSHKDFAEQKICGKRRRKPSGQAARNAAADLRALRRRGDSFRLLRRHLPQRGRQGNKRCPCFPNHFREQNHAFALRDSICTHRALIVK